MKKANWVRDTIRPHLYGFQADPEAQIQIDETGQLTHIHMRFLKTPLLIHIQEFAGIEHYNKINKDKLLPTTLSSVSINQISASDLKQADSPYLDTSALADKPETHNCAADSKQVNKIDVREVELPKYQHFNNYIEHLHMPHIDN
ncbi:unnamed protein product [Ambrosiozyma monospora]|uniref:Unnamed protein product n=1 Tax=Ambrosiozyma monospora TaxID=43982 RepID=A0ACB5UCF3_AMBMO|nr:unnamed protein product [Ambrosiozyma monospora]